LGRNLIESNSRKAEINSRRFRTFAVDASTMQDGEDVEEPDLETFS